MLLEHNGVAPKIGSNVFIAKGAFIIGRVIVGDYSSVWFQCTLRGDVCYIAIGERSNIQDNTTIHVTRTGIPTVIGSGVTVGHNCLLHACTIGEDSLVGMGSIIMDKAVIEPGAMLAAGSLLTERKIVQSGELWAGRPAKLVRKLSMEELADIKKSAQNYVELSAKYL